MFYTRISKLIVITMGCFLMSPIHELNGSKPFEATLSDESQETSAKEFMIGINTSRNLLNTNSNNITQHNLSSFDNSTTPLMFNTRLHGILPVLKEQIADKDVLLHVVVNEIIHNDFHYGINKSNQEHNSYNQKATPSLSNHKHVTSSSSSAEAASASSEMLTSTASASSAYFERVELQESLTQAKNEKLLLHRNKRYLVFPEGSSFQLVFDLIIPIVDYTNYAIMGITCAVAWELPSKPPSEIIENFRHKLNDGTFGLSRRNDSTQQQLKYINSQSTNEDEDERGGGGDGDGNVSLQQRLSATVATTSAHENFITNALKPPPANNFYYNNIHQDNFKLPTIPTPLVEATTFLYNQHPQQQKWHNYNLKMGDGNNQGKTHYGTDNGRPMHRYDFTPHSMFNKKPANKWNSQRWHQKQQQPQLKQTKPPYDDAGVYWNKGNWWERNKSRIEKQWHKNQQKWSPHQEKQAFYTSQRNYHTPPMFSQRTGRNRKILNKPPIHHIYPVFGKRRRRRSSDHRRYHPHDTVDDNDDLTKKLQEIHTREHLHTRQKLYGKIEKLFKTRGHNGTACVLRALCETEKLHLNARRNELPQSFVMELLRSIFALPRDTLTYSKESLLHIDTRYSDAVLHAHTDARSQSCSQQYDGCENGISYDMQF